MNFFKQIFIIFISLLIWFHSDQIKDISHSSHAIPPAGETELSASRPAPGPFQAIPKARAIASIEKEYDPAPITEQSLKSPVSAKPIIETATATRQRPETTAVTAIMSEDLPKKADSVAESAVVSERGQDNADLSPQPERKESDPTSSVLQKKREKERRNLGNEIRMLLAEHDFKPESKNLRQGTRSQKRAATTELAVHPDRRQAGSRFSFGLQGGVIQPMSSRKNWQSGMSQELFGRLMFSEHLSVLLSAGTAQIDDGKAYSQNRVMLINVDVGMEYRLSQGRIRPLVTVGIGMLEYDLTGVELASDLRSHRTMKASAGGGIEIMATASLSIRLSAHVQRSIDSDTFLTLHAGLSYTPQPTQEKTPDHDHRLLAQHD